MRPLYHFTPRTNWLSDPNGLVHDGARWHMFYQYNPLGEEWGHMAWGHATSLDLARWHEHPPALLEDEREMVFSGSAVIDRANSAGFGAGAMVAIFTGAAQDELCRQSQSLAYSTDHGISWHRFSGNPVLAHELSDFRDPSVFWHEQSQHWVMVVALSTQNALLIFVSDDLKAWRETCRIDAGLAPGNLWECPALIELPVRGTGRTHWLLKVDALNDSPGSGALYQTGGFDGERFAPDGPEWRTIDGGADFYAAIPWNGPRDEEGRVAWIGWMGRHAYQHQFPAQGWRGVMSVPRRLGLVECDGVLLAAQTVEPAVMALFEEASPMAVSPVQAPVACRIDVEAGYSGNLWFGDSAERCIKLEFAADHITCVRRDSDLPFLECERHLPRGSGQAVSILVDSETCEILSADGTLAASFQHRPTGPMLTLWADMPEAVSIAALRQGPPA